jgi:F-box domain
MNNVPIELFKDIFQNLDIVSYLRLRRTCKLIYKYTEPVPTLTFAAYKQSVALFGEVIITRQQDGKLKYKELPPKLGVLLRERPKMQLSLKNLTDRQFLYVVLNGHMPEFERILKSSSSGRLSHRAKGEALNEIIRKGTVMHPKAALILFKHERFSISAINNAFLWAIEFGQAELVSMLLPYPVNFGIVPLAIGEGHVIQLVMVIDSRHITVDLRKCSACY